MQLRSHPSRSPAPSVFDAVAPLHPAGHALLQLQRDAGNRAVCELVAVQRKVSPSKVAGPAAQPAPGARIVLDGLGEFAITSDVAWSMTVAIQEVADRPWEGLIEPGRIGFEDFAFTTPLAGAHALMRHHSHVVAKGGRGAKDDLTGSLLLPGWTLDLGDIRLQSVATSGGLAKVGLSVGQAIKATPTALAKGAKGRAATAKGWLQFDGQRRRTPVLAWDDLGRLRSGAQRFECKVAPGPDIEDFVNATMARSYARRNGLYTPKQGPPLEFVNSLIQRVRTESSGGRTTLVIQIVAENARAGKKP